MHNYAQNTVVQLRPMLTATGIKNTGVIKKAQIVAALTQWDVENVPHVAADLAPPMPKPRTAGRSMRTSIALQKSDPADQQQDAPRPSRKRKQSESAEEASSPAVGLPHPKRQKIVEAEPATPVTESGNPTKVTIQFKDDEASTEQDSGSDASTPSSGPASTGTPPSNSEESDDNESTSEDPFVNDSAPPVGVYTSKLLLTRNGGLRGIRVDEQRPLYRARIINQAEALKRLDRADQKLARRIDLAKRGWAMDDPHKKGIKASKVTKNRAAARKCNGSGLVHTTL